MRGFRLSTKVVMLVAGFLMVVRPLAMAQSSIDDGSTEIPKQPPPGWYECVEPWVTLNQRLAIETIEIFVPAAIVRVAQHGEKTVGGLDCPPERKRKRSLGGFLDTVTRGDYLPAESFSPADWVGIVERIEKKKGNPTDAELKRMMDAWTKKVHAKGMTPQLLWLQEYTKDLQARFKELYKKSQKARPRQKGKNTRNHKKR